MQNKITTFIKGIILSISWDLVYIVLSYLILIATYKIFSSFSISFVSHIIYWLKQLNIVNNAQLLLRAAVGGDINSKIYYFQTVFGHIILSISAIVITVILIKTDKNNKLPLKKINIKTLISCSLIAIILYSYSPILNTLIPLPEINIIPDIGVLCTLEQSTILVLLHTGIIGPIYEEVFFRYKVYNLFKPISEESAIVIQAIIFALCHRALDRMPYALFTGFVLGIIIYATDNIIYTIIMHIIMNSSSIILMRLGFNKSSILEKIFIIALILFIIIMWNDFETVVKRWISKRKKSVQ